MEDEKLINPDAPRWKTYPSYVAEEPPVEPEKKKKSISASISIIIFQFLLITILVGYILMFTQMKSSFSTVNNLLPSSLQKILMITQDTQQQERTSNSYALGNNQQHDQEYTSVFSQAIDTAQDLKRKADLKVLGAAVSMHFSEYGSLPAGIPDNISCIGTDPTCYDLYSILIPVFLDKELIDIQGSVENTGYSIGISHDGNTLVILHATGENGEIIEEKR